MLLLFSGVLCSRPAISMLEDAEKRGLITPGKVSYQQQFIKKHL
jgi:hypothetical protein